MNSIDMFLIQYGLVAIFILLLTKSIGVPIPIPTDVIILSAAVRAAEGKLVLWQAFLAILLALTIGGLIQFALIRGPGRSLLYRFGRYIGLTSPRLDAASARIRKGGILSLTFAILVPGVRGAAIAASGLADFPLRTFAFGLVLGSTLFITLHFVLGYLSGSIFSVITRVLPSSSLITVVLLLLLAVYILWAVAVHRQKVAHHELEADTAAPVAVWHEGICPICLALYTTNQLRPFPFDSTINK